MKKLILCLLAAVVVLSLVLTGCGPAATPTPSAPSAETPAPAAAPTETPVPPTPAPARTELRARLLGDVSRMDPCNTTTMHDHYIAVNIFSNLVNFKPGSSEIVPDLAETWETSPDGLVWTFHLREGVKFHKGYGEVNAQAVKYSLDRVLNPGEDTSCTNAQYLAALDKVEAVDDYTVQLTLKYPYAALGTSLAYRAGWIVPQKAIEELGEDFGLSPVGSGPYVLESWTPGEEIVLIANEDYYAGPPSIKKVTFKVIPDETVAALALEKGELDIAILRSSETFESLKANPNIVVDATPGTSVRVLAMNTKQEPFDDVRVRQAVAHAIDKDQIVNVALAGTVARTDNVIGPMTFGYTPDVRTYEYNPEKAKELLAEAGYPDGFEVTLYFTTLSPWPDIVPILKENLEAVGIKVELEGMEHGAYTAFRKQGEYQLLTSPLGRPPDPDLPLSIAYHSGNFPPGSNVSYYDQIDDLIEAGRKEMDPEKRKAIYAEIQKKMAEDEPVVPIGFQMVIAAMQPYVKGYTPGLSNEFWLYPMYFEE
jgi:peptide/nickel transport system substrate-binding protein